MKRFFKTFWPHAVFLFAVFILIVRTYSDYGVAWDEIKTIVLGKHYFLKFLNFFGIHISYLIDNVAYYFPRELFTIHLQGHGVLYDVATFVGVFLIGNFSFETFHLVRGLLSLLSVVLLSYIVTHLVNKRAGFFAMLFLILFPRYYGDMLTNSLDMPVVFFLSLSITVFLLVISSKKSTLNLTLLGLLIGITVGQRLLMGYFAVITLIFLGCHFYFVQKKSIKESIVVPSIVGISALILMTITHPWLITHPVTGIFDFIAAAKQYPWNASVLFEGQFIAANNLPWYYLPKSIIITSPLFILFLFFVGIGSMIKSFSSKKIKVEKKFLYGYILAIFFIPICLTMMLRPTLYDSWRHFLFLTIPLVIIASIGFDRLLSLRNMILRVIVCLCIAANMLLTAREIVRLHPYQYIYYNSLVGGLAGAYTNYETDYWGLSYKEAVEWFINHENKPEKEYQIFSEGEKLSTQYYFKKNMQFTDNPNKADYIFTFTRWNMQDKHGGTTIHTISREGVPLIFIKKMSSK